MFLVTSQPDHDTMATLANHTATRRARGAQLLCNPGVVLEQGCGQAFLQAMGHCWAAACQLTCVTTICNSTRTGWVIISQKTYSFIFRVTLTNLEKTFKKVFLLIFSLPLCVIALINIKGLNKYLQIISLTFKNN